MERRKLAQAATLATLPYPTPTLTTYPNPNPYRGTMATARVANRVCSSDNQQGGLASSGGGVNPDPCAAVHHPTPYPTLLYLYVFLDDICFVPCCNRVRTNTVQFISFSSRLTTPPRLGAEVVLHLDIATGVAKIPEPL